MIWRMLFKRTGCEHLTCAAVPWCRASKHEKVIDDAALLAGPPPGMCDHMDEVRKVSSGLWA